MTKRFGLSKAEKLKSRKAIDTLFEGKQRFSAYPLQVWYRFEGAGEGEGGSIRMGVSCSKRHFKRAVDRNRIKRLMREAYRLQKGILLEHLPGEAKGLLFFVYIDKVLPSYDTVYTAMTRCLQTLKKKIPHEPAA